MATKKIFVSYDYDNDRNYKNLLLAWSKNTDFDFYMNDQSTDVSIDSTDAAAIRRVISARISGATYFLCLVGKATYKSRWVAWEIAKAIELKKRLVGVKIEKDNTPPSGLLGQGATWALSFTFDGITKAIEATSDT